MSFSVLIFNVIIDLWERGDRNLWESGDRNVFYLLLTMAYHHDNNLQGTCFYYCGKNSIIKLSGYFHYANLC